MTCAEHIDVDTALAFVDNELIADRRAAVEQRIDACPRCREIVAEAAKHSAPNELPTDIDPVQTVSARRARKRELAPLPSSSSLEPGVRVGRYVVERAIGAGGMGVVTLARDPELRRAVVIKLVKPDAFGEGDESRDELEARLQREAQAMAQLSHPNVVQIFDIGRHGDRVFLAMEYVDGQTLDGWLLEHQRSRDEILAMFRQAGAGLAAAHRAGLIHRDFKPSNVLVSGGTAKVTDFGLARSARSIAASAQVTQKRAIARPSGVHAVLTHVDAVIGTPAYMAPEQAAGRADARSDQFSFALVLLDALVRQSPTRRDVPPEGPADEIERELDKVGVEPRARRAITRALADDPAARFATLDEMLAELAPITKRRTRLWPLAAGLLLCGGAVAIWGVAQQRDQHVAVGPECTASSARVWTPDARAKLVATFAANPRPFESWTGASIATAIDRAAGKLAVDEIAVCELRAGVDATCVMKRSTALAEALAKLPARLDDPWSLVRPIDDCNAKVATAKRPELAGLTYTQALALAIDANNDGDGRLSADAYEVAAKRAFADGNHAAGEAALRGQLEAGERANDDASRGRALLQLLDVARWNGDYAAASRDGNALRSIYARQTPTSRDELTIAKQEARTFMEVGDVTRADGAWSRALEAATRSNLVDDQLDIRAAQAQLRALRFDPASAMTQITDALDLLSVASVQARARAFVVKGELALATGDLVTARTALLEASSLDPALAKSTEQRIRIAQTREPDSAIAELEAIAKTATERVSRLANFARAHVLRSAQRFSEALELLRELSSTVRTSKSPVAMHERFAIIAEECDAELDLAKSAGCSAEVVKSFHPMAPQRARNHLLRIRDNRVHGLVYLLPRSLEAALAVLVELEAPAVLIAELRWELARCEQVEPEQRRAAATAARAAFAAAGRTAEVEQIDLFLAAP
ncbi:MAG: protein kinase [Kofleriaceae bacterium]